MKDEDAKGAEQGEEASSGGGATHGRARAADETADERRRAARKGPRGGGVGRTGALMVFALLVGGAAGWFARHAQAQTRGAAEGGAASCQTWEEQICSGAGQEAMACYEAKAAANLLPDAACETALESVPDTLAKAAASREVCNTIVGKLCADLGPETPTCGLVRERTELFPAERCQEMLGNYDQVLEELRSFQEQMAPGAIPPPGIEAPGAE